MTSLCGLLAAACEQRRSSTALHLRLVQLLLELHVASLLVLALVVVAMVVDCVAARSQAMLWRQARWQQ